MLARTALIIFAAGLFLVSAEGDFVSQAHGDETQAIREELNRLENADPALRTASLNVYVTLRAQTPLTLDSVELLLDGKRLVRHLYTERESQALQNQAVHRIYSGNLGPGVHELQAEFVGFSKGHRSVTAKYVEKVSASAEPTHIELVISDAAGSKEPTFEIRKW